MYQRLVLVLPTVLLASLLVFVLVRVLPGDVAAATLGETASRDQVEAYREKLGLNDPLPTQYLDWIRGVAVLDFGNSQATGRSVRAILYDALPVTVELAILGMVIGLAVGVPLGVLGAIFHGKWVDVVCQVVAVAGLSVPSFVLGLLAILLPVIWWGWSPPVTYHRLWADPLGNLGQFILPAAILSLRLAGVNARMTRSAMLEVMRADYIRTAHAKGLAKGQVWLRHALRNVLVPVVTISGLQMITLLGGVVIIEQIFGLPGLGRFLIDSVGRRDYVAVQGIVLVMALAAALINLGVDLSYIALDPRLRSWR